MKSNTTSVKETPLFVIIDDRKIQLDRANITLIRTATGATFQLTGTAADLGQINELNAYLQSIPVEPVQSAA